MKRFRYIIVLAWVTGIVSACTDLDTKMNNQWSVDDTWTNAEKAQGVLLSVYQDVLTVPINIAQEITDKMVDGGIKAVWNFTPFRIRVPENIVVQNTSLYAHLAVMFNRLNFNEK